MGVSCLKISLSSAYMHMQSRYWIRLPQIADMLTRDYFRGCLIVEHVLIQ
jgi:hypothetical protein